MAIRSAIIAALAASAAALGANAGAQISPVNGKPIIASYHVRGMCLDVRASDKAVLMWTCHGGDNQAFRFASGSYGQIRLPDGTCLTGSARGQVVSARGCNASDHNQKWGFQSDGTLRNESGYCADVEGGSRDAGARIVMWDCNSRASNQLWYPAVTAKSALVGLAALSAVSTSKPQGVIASSSFSAGNMVAAGGGNLVAAGGGNMVAAGGGNMVAAGGGNIVFGGAGSKLVAAGGGNLVAAGGGNFISTNGGNLLPNNYNFFNNSRPGNLVGNDGAS